MPEVSLVAILDADREGFLRSDSSLIQTMGRAARNVRGKVIMYADRITGSMQRAIDETERRRQKQLAYNEEHGITPQTVQKKIADIMEGARDGQPSGRRRRSAAVAEEEANYEALGPAQLAKAIGELEKKMFQHAENLEFEDAAKVRDQIEKLKDRALKSPEMTVFTD